MRLDEYIWSRNPRGLHVQRVLITPLDHSRWTDAHFGWAKLVAAGDEYVDDAAQFIAAGITPVVRLYVERPGSMPFNGYMQELTRQYAAVGVKWFEFYNEPNLVIEWPDGTANISWSNFDGMIRPLVDNWMNWAEFIISLGCYPGFTAFAESADYHSSAVFWMDQMLGYIARTYADRFRNILANGAFCATHPYILNHYYQEVPGGGPTSYRAPEQQNAREGGWHFEYPYDPICQRTDPGRTVYGGTPLTPYGDPVGLTAMGRMFNERCAALFGTQAVPVVGTEGGIWPFLYEPGKPAERQQDNRYPPYTRDSQAEGTVALFEWAATQAPPWFFGVCLWKEDEYYEAGGGFVPAIGRLRETPPLLKTVLPLDVVGALGPGPIKGEPTFHAVIVAPGLDPRWFFETAQPYWNRYRPIVTTSWEFIERIPSDKSLAVTVIAPPDMTDSMTQAIHKRFPNVLFDLLIAAGDPKSVADTLNARVWSNKRFG
jgi:hypothetical protein